MRRRGEAAQAVDYVGAGTIEFIADASEGLRADRIWFMEMNTRLQVEHPVTEEITGVDLVEWQLRVACGEPLPQAAGRAGIDGWAMEARLYAEDPAKGFLPSDRAAGPTFDLPDGDARRHRGRGRATRSSPFYDPMIAKLIVHAARRGTTRSTSCWRRTATTRRVLAGEDQRRVPVSRAATHPDFSAGTIDTGLIERKVDALIPTARARAIALLAGWRLTTPLRSAREHGHDADSRLERRLSTVREASMAFGSMRCATSTDRLMPVAETVEVDR